MGAEKVKRKSNKNKLAIGVDDDIIKGTKSDKLWHVIKNDKLTWKENLHRDNENEGMITLLKEKMGTLKRLSKYMSHKDW